MKWNLIRIIILDWVEKNSLAHLVESNAYTFINCTLNHCLCITWLKKLADCECIEARENFPTINNSNKKSAFAINTLLLYMQSALIKWFPVINRTFFQTIAYIDFVIHNWEIALYLVNFISMLDMFSAFYTFAFLHVLISYSPACGSKFRECFWLFYVYLL